MTAQSIVSPEDQNATFVELFFDLVFVFAVTQLVGLLHDGLTWTRIGEAILVFWLVWWAWTQFTWALNAADTTHPWVEVATLVSTAVAFFMAVAVPHAFEGYGLWFAVPYVAVRGIGLLLYGRVAEANHAAQQAAVRTFCLVSFGGLAAVLLGAFAGGSTQYYFWGFAILLDIIAAAIAGQAEGWDLHPLHFAERHGLFVIIALGESLIVAASGLSGSEWTASAFAVAVLTVATTCGMWWCYFPRGKPAIEHGLACCRGVEQSTLARDAYSLAHFPMLAGIIAYALAVEEALAHPGTPLPLDIRITLAVGVALFVGGLVIVIWRAKDHVLVPRAVIAAVTALVLIATGGIPPAASLAIAFAGLAAIALVEERQFAPA